MTDLSRQTIKKLFSFALGRQLEYYDEATLRELMIDFEQDERRFGSYAPHCSNRYVSDERDKEMGSRSHERKCENEPQDMLRGVGAAVSAPTLNAMEGFARESHGRNTTSPEEWHTSTFQTALQKEHGNLSQVTQMAKSPSLNPWMQPLAAYQRPHHLP